MSHAGSRCKSVTPTSTVKKKKSKRQSRLKMKAEVRPSTETAEMCKTKTDATEDQVQNHDQKQKQGPTKRSKSSSPDKYRVVRRQPSLRLPPYTHEVEPKSAIKSESSGLKSKIGDPACDPFIPSLGASDFFENGGRIEDALNNELIQVQSYPDCQPSTSSLSYTYPKPTRLKSAPWVDGLPDILEGVKTANHHILEPCPEFLTAMGVDLSHSPTSSSSSTLTSCEGVALPHYAYLFRLRIPPDGDLGSWQLPVPKAGSIEQTLAIRSRLTKFHAGVLLVDALAGENETKRFQGLRNLVEDNIVELKELGIQRHQIVYYYHGRGEMRTGNEIWNAIEEWELREKELRLRGVLTRTKQDLKGQEERRRRECGELREVERNRRPNTQARKWNEFAKHEETKKHQTRKWNEFAKHEMTKNRVRGAYGHLRSLVSEGTDRCADDYGARAIFW